MCVCVFASSAEHTSKIKRKILEFSLKTAVKNVLQCRGFQCRIQTYKNSILQMFLRSGGDDDDDGGDSSDDDDDVYISFIHIIFFLSCRTIFTGECVSCVCSVI